MCQRGGWRKKDMGELRTARMRKRSPSDDAVAPIVTWGLELSWESWIYTMGPWLPPRLSSPLFPFPFPLSMGQGCVCKIRGVREWHGQNGTDYQQRSCERCGASVSLLKIQCIYVINATCANRNAKNILSLVSFSMLGLVNSNSSLLQ